MDFVWTRYIVRSMLLLPSLSQLPSSSSYIPPTVKKEKFFLPSFEIPTSEASTFIATVLLLPRRARRRGKVPATRRRRARHSEDEIEAYSEEEKEKVCVCVCVCERERR